MKILVTGAAGKLGSAVCAELHGAGNEVRGVDIVPNRASPVPIEFFDLRDPMACMRLIDGADAVVHLANHTNGHYQSFHTVYSENCAVNGNVFHAAARHGVRRVVFASSIQVISGSRTGRDADKASVLSHLPLDSDLQPHPGNSYALSKVAGEGLLQYLTEFCGVEAAFSLRFPWLMRSLDWIRHRDGRTMGERDFRHVSLDEGFLFLLITDAARLIRCCLESSVRGYRCYLAASPAPAPYKMPVSEIADRFFPGVPRKPMFEERNVMCDIGIITNETGWEATPVPDFGEAT